MTKRITLSSFTSDSLKTIWQQGFTENDPEWAPTMKIIKNIVHSMTLKIVKSRHIC